MGVLSAQTQADLLKDRGNIYFKKEKLGAAIEAYTEAITLCPGVPVYWTNRAVCERKRNEWEKVEADCRRALELDSQSVKAHYMLGLALLHYQQYEEAVNKLEKAMDLNRGATINYMVEDIWQELSKARFSEWEAVSGVRKREQLDLKTYVLQLMRDDYQRQLRYAIAGMKNEVSVIDSAQAPISKTEVQGENDDSGRGSGGNDSGKEKKIGTERIFPLRTDADLKRLYRTLSEPPRSSGSVGERTAFDPLRHHKLSRRRSNSRSSSIRRQLSTSDAVLDDFAGAAAPLAPDIDWGPGPPGAGTKDRIKSKNQESRARMPPQAPAAAGPADVPRPERTSTSGTAGDGEPGSDHSIYDVFKVFKEFMKMHRNEAGQKLLRVSETYQRRSKVLGDVFDKVAAPDRQDEVPDHLCCKITMDVFRDPVITSSGISYERSAILDHLRKVGQFDPFTRAPLTEEQVVPNLALKEAVQVFLNEHGWAYGAC